MCHVVRRGFGVQIREPSYLNNRLSNWHRIFSEIYVDSPFLYKIY